MATSPYEWNILEWDEKIQTNTQTKTKKVADKEKKKKQEQLTDVLKYRIYNAIDNKSIYKIFNSIVSEF